MKKNQNLTGYYIQETHLVQKEIYKLKNEKSYRNKNSKNSGVAVLFLK